MQITVTPQATKQLLASGLHAQNFLRIGVRQGGCAGLSYDAFIDNAATEADAFVYQDQALRIVVAKELLHHVEGLTIDFSDDLVQPGFILKNPNAQKSCGCGASFKANEADAMTACGGSCG